MDDRSLEAARLYYLHEETMDSIAARFGCSRSTVSRLLADARERGLVRIEVADRPSDSPLATEIRSRFGARLHLVPTRAAASPISQLDQVAVEAARALVESLSDGMILGMAWGTTVAAIANRLPRKRLAGLTVVQLNGAANSRTTGIPVMADVATPLSDAFGATLVHFPVPAFFDFPETRRALWRERSVRAVLELQSRADVAVFGVGSFDAPVASQVYAGGYLSAAETQALRDDGVVGDVCTVLLRADGSWLDIGLNERASGPNPTLLRQIPRRICAAAGPAKAPAVAGALHAGVATDLVIDAQLAASLEKILAR